MKLSGLVARSSFNTSLFISFALLASCANQPVRKSYRAADDAASQKLTSKSLSVKTAQAAYQKGDYAGAAATLDAIPESSVSINEQTEYNNLRGLVYLAQKKPIQAESSFRKALATNTAGEYRGYYQYNLASSMFEADKKTEANDILNAIDLAKLDSSHQAKVQNLKEKINSKASAAKTSPSMNTGTAANGQPEADPFATSSPSTTVIATPTETYSGAVNKHRIGLLLPLSGKYETFGKKVQRAIELAFQHSSDSNAKEFELISVDSGDTTETRLEAIRKLVEEDQVIAIIGPVLSKGIETLAARAAYYQVPLVSMAQVQGPTASHLFSCSISSQDQASQIIEYAMKEKGYSRFAILAPSNNPGEEMANAFWNEITARKGEIKAFEMYDPDITDFRAPVDKSIGLFYNDARASELKELAEKRKELNITKKTMKTQQYFSLKPIVDFDAIIIADEAKVVGQIIPTFAYRDAKDLHYFGITSWNSPQLIQRAQEQAEGSVFPVAFNTLAPPTSTKSFYDLYLGTYNAYPGELDAIAFDSAAMVLKALKESPSSRDDFRKVLEQVKEVEAATGELSMTDHRCARKLSLYTVQKGKFMAVDTKKK